jgi:predicted metal-dependent enzyme (double-stranded beta helix superfamily)
MSDRPLTMRSCAQRIIELLDEVGDDVLAKEKELTRAVEDVLALADLDTVVATPVWTDADEGEATTGWLYNDGDVRIVRGTLPAGYTLAPHNHGAWNLFGVYRGAVKYTSYRRLDDRSRPYHADLEVAEDRIMSDGDVTILPAPPHDIHGVVGLAPLSTTVLVARGAFSTVREQYLPDQRCYIHRSGDARGKG